MLSEFSPDICPWANIAVALRCLRMGKIDVITYKYVINRLMHAFSISSREADIGQSDNSPDMEKGMH